MTTAIDNPILNSPYEQPDRYYEVGPKGPTGGIRDGRRPSESFIPIAMSKKGKDAEQVPDFLVRLKRRDHGDVVRTLIIEVSGSHKSPGPTKAKAETARNSWCVAVNNYGGFGRWGYTEMTNPLEFKARLAEAMRLMYDDAPIIGDPDLLDFDDRRSVRGA